MELRGFVLNLVVAFRDFVHQPLARLFSFLEVTWHPWMTIAFTISSVAYAALALTMRDIMHEARRAKDAWEEFSSDWDRGYQDNMVERISEKFMGVHLLKMQDVKLRWWEMYILPFRFFSMRLSETHRHKVTWEKVRKSLNAEDEPLKREILRRAKEEDVLLTDVIARRFLIWMLALVLLSVVLLIVGSALSAPPAPQP